MRGTKTLLLVLLVSFLAACQGGTAATTEPAPTATATIDPLITPTVVPAGIAEKPLQMVLYPASFDEAVALEADLEAAILDAASVYVDVVLVERPSEALAALCSSTDDLVISAWVGQLGYAAALAQRCGTPSLEVSEGSGEDLRIGTAGYIVLSRVVGSVDLGVIRGRTFCRLGYDDFYSWLLPSIVLPVNRVRVPQDIDQLVDYDSVESMIEAVIAGDCTAAGISETDYAALLADNETLEDDARIAFTSPVFPDNVLLVPLELGLSFRLSLEAGMLDLSSDAEMDDLLQPFFGADDFVLFEPGDYADMDLFLSELGLDFNQLGD